MMTLASDLAARDRRPHCVCSNATNARRRVGPWSLRLLFIDRGVIDA
jgi:hypothetical protein